MATPANTQQRQGGPATGDLTGRTRERLSREAIDEQREAALHTTMATAAEEEEREHGVFDGRTGERLDGDHDEVEEVDEQPPPIPHFGGPSATRERVFTGRETEEEIEMAVQAERARLPEPTELALTPFVTIRTNQDIEKMTYGMTPNGEPDNYNFRAGLAYRVPRELAEHLSDIGVIQQVVAAN